MNITFEFFGVLQRLAGGSSCSLTLPVNAGTVADALQALARGKPELSAALERCACAIGDELVLRAHPLSPGARLALLPPVAGG